MRNKNSGIVVFYAVLLHIMLMGLWPLVLRDVLLIDVNTLPTLHGYSLGFGPIIAIPVIFYILENMRISRLERRYQQFRKTTDSKDRLSKTRAAVSF